jgi:hypothetical protein
LTTYVGLVGVACWALNDQWHWVFDIETYASIFRDNSIPWKLRVYYLIEIGYYIFGVFAMLFEPAMKDRLQMFTHHVFTLTLMLSSYHL